MYHFIFGSPERLAHRVVALIPRHKEANLVPKTQTNHYQKKWLPPFQGDAELNFDAGKIRNWGCGLGFVIQDSLGDVLIAGSKQVCGAYDTEVSEAEACVLGVR